MIQRYSILPFPSSVPSGKTASANLARQNPRNWTVAKKAFVTFNICLLTFSIYIGSAIYTSGLRDIIQEFAVSQTVATLGLTLYVLGYGMGPMIFVSLSKSS